MLTQRHLGLVIAGLAIALCISCGTKDPTPQLPVTQAVDRTRHKIGRVDLIVQDADRAAKVKSTYKQIETLLLDAVERGAARRGQLLTLEPSEDAAAEIQAIFAEEKAWRHNVQEAYFGLQMQLRQNVTESEFKKLNEVR